MAEKSTDLQPASSEGEGGNHPPISHELSSDEWFLIAQEKDITIHELQVEILELKAQLGGTATPTNAVVEAEEGETIAEEANATATVVPVPPSGAPSARGASSPRAKVVEANEADEQSTKKDKHLKMDEKNPASKVNDKVLAMIADDTLEKKNLEHMTDANREKNSTKAAKLVGSNVVLKKKLRDRFGSEMHMESKEMMAARDKYEAMKQESALGK